MKVFLNGDELMKRVVFLLALFIGGAVGIALAQDQPPAPPPAEQPPPAPPLSAPQAVTVTAKIIEFQATKGVETGLSAYFQRRNRVNWFGVVKPPVQGIMNADFTFPASTASGITVFLDRLRLTEGDLEMILQGLVNENKAEILSRPRLMVMVGGDVNQIGILQRVPYENTSVVGYVPVQTTEFENTGVSLQVEVPKVVDLDGDWNTKEDTLIQLQVRVEVSEEGQRIVVALDNRGDAGVINASKNDLTAPEFVSRTLKTRMWVRDGQTLVMGGLYRNAKTKSLSSAPWVTQAEDMAIGLAERVVPGNVLGSPVSATLGNRATNESRRELVFFIKAESWRPAFTVATDNALQVEEPAPKPKPADVITGVLEGITQLPQGIAEGIKRESGSEGITSELGGRK